MQMASPLRVHPRFGVLSEREASATGLRVADASRSDRAPNLQRTPSLLARQAKAQQGFLLGGMNKAPLA